MFLYVKNILLRNRYLPNIARPRKCQHDLETTLHKQQGQFTDVAIYVKYEIGMSHRSYVELRPL